MKPSDDKAPSAVSYRSLLDHATELLYPCSETPRIDSEVLLQHILGQSTAWLIAYGDSLASADHTLDFFKLVEQRQQGHPIAYLLGYKEFWNLRLKVNQHVLIPRSDTETVVEQALQKLEVESQAKILDLGTGSGAIALAIAKERPISYVFAVDSSKNALELAKENARSNKLTNVEFILSNWFDKLSDIHYDLIVSNPPYIAANDPHLQQGDLRFEPAGALVSGSDGFDDLRLIISAAPDHLSHQGHLLLEHGFNQHELVAKILLNQGFNNIEMYRDINGLPRCTLGQWLA